MKKNEARILVFLYYAAKPLRHGKIISNKLKIDYAYVMKLLEVMYDKGWLTSHKFHGRSYFKVTFRSPTKEAKERLAEVQTKLDNNGD